MATHWLYVREPHLDRRLLLVSVENEVTIYVRMRADRNGARPRDVVLGSPRWRREQALARGASTSFGGVDVIHRDDGSLEAHGSKARREQHPQLLLDVRAGVGDPPMLAEIWA